MSRTCQITGKTPLTGNKVSHAKNKTKMRQLPNLQSKVLMNPATGRLMRILVSAHGLRTLAKWQKEGRKYDLKEIVNS
ncbi:50S ribosomal protein L28 [Candidatus Uhrbacteria bacterium CG_4_9_14_0_2_um_filter_41_50]|uniref:Large ribosomal subunit protein bL28 n=1 Tax=Candidatus Uhrbacteria bacterium CG_4_9_14_0_2_um_filter_41_50 TaxID=1975031 RepID=A0A2M8EP93_9BACT|nr:MAG: 50S ribosomal protein L28 [Candidatus Uhrbacteria bacterium CG_4_10_14_3_um_filter_41_21]PIZ54506.1 MAG: 50S ribosomal protein L28 [Candidatus Uhrbacteria bacterium CG_4_10_14_0_2_um_filter_41_21]PJB84477.1 MAG: 50S ribosomal protein L28 [Candidatus Uhrbacteria bacterium CG_4_9_14_0_8_um_filter_41_16]PJC24564.1 MAG: 50S ribosomal protein L28 [Candidatus Uhrbacteria bacterium CG_4_9_14_0_2_um_filter_41_50]PJE74785.1 MAG: 50S ribosomal protein L28 [Candidatus Uhrbacteria bacterium CG10_bi